MLATYVRFDTPMIDVPGDSFLLSTNQILVRRTRLILLICLVGAFVFTMLTAIYISLGLAHEPA